MLSVESVSYSVKKWPLVRDISFTLRPGEVLALLGANGAGKSTLIGMLCGQILPAGGQILFDGQPLNTYDPAVLAKKRATLSQHNSINMPFESAEIVMMGRYPHFRNRPTRHDEDIVQEAMSVCGIRHLANRDFLSLSGGEQQRVQLARVLSQIWDCPGALLILDEPIAAMDAYYQQQTLAIVKAFAAKGFMVLAALHEINLAAQYADRLLMMKEGRRWRDGTPAEVLTPLNIYTVFSIETEVVINPRTLNPYVIPKEIRLHADHFNSKLPLDHTPTLREKYLLHRERFPQQSPAAMARSLGVSEAELTMLSIGEGATLLRPEMAAILAALPELGEVSAIAIHRGASHAIKGIFDTSRLQPLLQHWTIALAVDDQEEDFPSLRFFDRHGAALFRIFLSDRSDAAAYLRLIDYFKADIQQAPDLVGSAAASEMAQHIHPAQLDRFKQRMAEIAAASTVMQITLHNTGCRHCYQGPVSNLVDMGEWYHMADKGFNLYLHEKEIAAIQEIQPAAETPELHVRLLDKQGRAMLSIEPFIA